MEKRQSIITPGENSQHLVLSAIIHVFPGISQELSISFTLTEHEHMLIYLPTNNGPLCYMANNLLDEILFHYTNTLVENISCYSNTPIELPLTSERVTKSLPILLCLLLLRLKFGFFLILVESSILNYFKSPGGFHPNINHFNIIFAITRKGRISHYNKNYITVKQDIKDDFTKENIEQLNYDYSCLMLIFKVFILMWYSRTNIFVCVGVWFCFSRRYHNCGCLLHCHMSITGFHPPNGCSSPSVLSTVDTYSSQGFTVFLEVKYDPMAPIRSRHILVPIDPCGTHIISGNSHYDSRYPKENNVDHIYKLPQLKKIRVFNRQPTSIERCSPLDFHTMPILGCTFKTCAARHIYYILTEINCPIVFYIIENPQKKFRKPGVVPKTLKIILFGKNKLYQCGPYLALWGLYRQEDSSGSQQLLLLIAWCMRKAEHAKVKKESIFRAFESSFCRLRRKCGRGKAQVKRAGVWLQGLERALEENWADKSCSGGRCRGKNGPADSQGVRRLRSRGPEG
ncbi:hypothetical protein VP01_273g2 [Puccinia sorghi]|uniref:Uncharacterized protein n=1 Tax=Puccinia sorghi TaxID=27349 RepID=A0A0L6V379_9BASI|nr:hypothetical protein VP01_273g2 [Puccinia sorghi]